VFKSFPLHFFLYKLNKNWHEYYIFIKNIFQNTIITKTNSFLNKMEEIEIKIVKEWNIDEIVELYKAGNWWKDCYDKKEIPNLIKGSYLFAVVVLKNSNKAVAMGRVLSDGKSDAYLQDIVVKKEYREKGYGKRLIEFLIRTLIDRKITWISLIAEPGQDDFYHKLGFRKMKDYTPMKYVGK